MTAFQVLAGRPEGEPGALPLTIAIDPGSATADEVAEVLSKISELYVLVGGKPIVWKVECLCPCHTGIEGVVLHDEPCCAAYDRGSDA